MRLGIIGSRSFKDRKLAEDIFSKFFKDKVEKIISGDCPSGGDKIGKDIAEKFNIEYKGYPAEWDNLEAIPCKIRINKYGKKYNAVAGFNRNRDIVNSCDLLLAFWDGESRGTKDSIEIAKTWKIPTMIIYF